MTASAPPHATQHPDDNDDPLRGTPTDSPTMRIYDTPPGRAAEVAEVLQDALYVVKGEPPRGRATAVEGNRVVVVAPVTLHPGIEQLCTTLSQQGTSPHRTARLSYWLVLAEPAQTTDTSAVPELAQTLEDVAGRDGPARFTVAERTTVRSLLNATGRTESPRARYRQVATAQGDVLVADLDIDLSPGFGQGGELHTRVSIPPQHTVVVGSSGWAAGDREDQGEGRSHDQRLYYVVRADLLDAS